MICKDDPHYRAASDSDDDAAPHVTISQISRSRPNHSVFTGRNYELCDLQESHIDDDRILLRMLLLTCNEKSNRHRSQSTIIDFSSQFLYV